MYVGGYDRHGDGKTSVRSRIESENAQREKKMRGMQDFHRCALERVTRPRKATS